MTQSETVGKLAEALSSVQGALAAAKRESTNPFYGSRYADLAAVWEAVRSPLSAAKLAVSQTTEVRAEQVVLVTTLLHASGEWLRGEYPLHPMRQTRGEGWVDSSDPQAIGSAVTYARRYALAAILGVVADDDDDGEAAMKRAPEERQAAAQRNGAACPKCGVVGSIIKGKPEYGGGWVCFKKKGGCGEKFAFDPAEQTVVYEQDASGALAPNLEACEPLLSVVRAATTVPEVNRLVKALTASDEWRALDDASREHVKAEVRRYRDGLTGNGGTQ